MTPEEFRSLIIDALSQRDEIVHILNSDDSLLVSCNDHSSFYLNIFESKQTFVHNDQEEEEYFQEYTSTHSKDDFAKDLLKMTKDHPGFFLYFMIFSKLEEMEIIDNGLFYHILDCIVYHEHEIDSFVSDLLSRYHLDKPSS